MTNKSGAIGTRTELFVHVLGIPAPQGSKRHVGRGILIESSKNVAPWRDSVAYVTREAMRKASWVTLDGPCDVSIDFYLPRPLTMPKGRTRPHVKPDIDKLVRSTLDALTSAGAIADDSRIVSLSARKFYAGVIFAGTGAVIRICPLPVPQSHGERRNPLAGRPSDPPDGSEGISGPREVSG